MTENLMTRRDLLKNTAGATAGAALMGAPSLFAQNNKNSNKTVTAIVIGAGNRGSTYCHYAAKFPDQFKIVGVAEPVKERNANTAKRYSIPTENRFDTWEDVFKRPKFADAVIISTPDDLHYGPAMAALNAGYDLLLEKPIAPSWAECKDILELATKKKRIVAVCHVLRYAPYFVHVRDVIQSGKIGEVVSIHHVEPIHHIHFSHSYVRGIWRNSDVSTPLILGKSCHDLDILNWWVGKKCTDINMFGDQRVFHKGNKPQGATKKCFNCPHNKTCTYSAMRIYLWERRWGTGHLLQGKPVTEANITDALKTGQYGHCVYQNDNNQPDHLTLNMRYEDGTTVTMGCEALTSYGGRKTRIMGTKGDIVGDEHNLTVFNFKANKAERWNVRDYAKKNKVSLGGHGGGDMLLVRDFVKAVKAQDANLLSSSLQLSMASHLMGFKAEESRKSDGEVKRL